jgi:hypothetical protein
VDYQFSRQFGIGLDYIGDEMSWPGRFHRIRPGFGAAVSPQFRFDVTYTAGVLQHCGDTDIVHGAHVRASWLPQPLEAYVQYAYIVELERRPLPAFLMGEFDENVCPDEVGPLPPGVPPFIADTRSHDMGMQVLYHWGRKTIVRGGYGIQLRVDGDDNFHVFHFAVRRWF